ISLGTGGNESKRIADPFESELLRLVAKNPGTLWIDKGAGGEEAVRVDRAVVNSGISQNRVRTWEGSFAGFADIIARSRLYVGYDSAGQHAAAALGVPLLSIFAGFPSLRMFQRWRPTGAGRIEIVRVDNPDPIVLLAQVEKSLDSLLP
ncbi:MAG: glycosyltransferase family 9 protein, partial [Acidobacteriota bacterium]|nr:glycosyltransferase family 9 protein [Acidobacteriota bacterium]